MKARRQHQQNLKSEECKGFTLIELLVVLVIAGLIISFTAVNLTHNARRALEEEANKLALLFQIAHDEAQLQGETIRWEGTLHGYRFLRINESKWEPLKDDMLKERAWSSPLNTITLNIYNQFSAPTLDFGQENISAPFSLILDRDGVHATIIGDSGNQYYVQQ